MSRLECTPPMVAAAMVRQPGDLVKDGPHLPLSICKQLLPLIGRKEG